MHRVGLRSVKLCTRTILSLILKDLQMWMCEKLEVARGTELCYITLLNYLYAFLAYLLACYMTRANCITSQSQ